MPRTHSRFALAFAMLAMSLFALFPIAAFAQDTDTDREVGRTMTAQLSAMNDSGASGTATITMRGTEITVEIESSGLVPNQPHAQHVHGALGQDSRCPDQSADTNGDGIVDTAEGQPFYGGVMVSLTESGDTGGDSALAVDRFPTADAQGNVNYSRTFEVSQEVADGLSRWAVVQHGIDRNGNGEYDDEAGQSSLDPSLPLEATAPANCGTFTAAGQSGAGAADQNAQDTGQAMTAPQGGVGTGFGGSSDEGLGLVAIIVAVFGLIATASVFAVRRLGSHTG